MNKNTESPVLTDSLVQSLQQKSYTWLVTGVAGFIGSHLLETLLHHDQKVIGIDNLEFGYQKNLDDVQKSVGSKWSSFSFIKEDICNITPDHPSLQKLDFILHHAALASVPGSIENPIKYQKTNVEGFLKIMNLAKNVGVQKMTYASSSAVYGENDFELQQELRLGQLLSPYAANKLTNEIDAQTWHSCYKLPTIGFRYFNIFGPRQDPKGAYSAVIPKWITRLLQGEDVDIYGDGLQVRDFCFVQNVVNANLTACLKSGDECNGQVFNISASEPIDLNQLAKALTKKVSQLANSPLLRAHHLPARDGDIKVSKADMDKAKNILGYKPLVSLEEGLQKTLLWYSKN